MSGMQWQWAVGGVTLRAAVVAGAILLSGCSGPRVVFVPTADAPVRAGPGMRGRVYVWTGAAWELSRNRVPVPEGFYIWDAGDPAPASAK